MGDFNQMLDYLEENKIQDIGTLEKPFQYFFKDLNNFKERDIIYDLIDQLEIQYDITIVKFSLEYKKDGSYFIVEKIN